MSRHFRLGELVTSLLAEKALEETDQAAATFLARHIRCDWGYVTEEQRSLNEQAIVDGQGVIKGVYKSLLGVEFWIVTDANWRRTRVILPEEL